jgi:hypothetical protein
MSARSSLGLFAIALALGVAPACGGNPPTVAPAGSATPSPTPTVAAAQEPPPDVSPAPAPGGLGVTVHLAHPRATFQQLASFLGPIAALLGTSSKIDLEGLVTLAVGAPIGALIDLDQPVDFAMSDVDSPTASAKMAGAVVLNEPTPSRETLETLQKYYKLVPTARGVTRLEPRDDAPDDASPHPCMLAPASGADGAPHGSRLVCGDTPDSVRHLGPYLARTMTRIASRDDLRVEVFVRELHSAKRSHADDVPAAGPAGAGPDAKDPTDRLLGELTDRLTDDVGSVVLEASSDGAALDVRLTTRFADAGSPLTRALVGLGPATAPPPAAFERLPREASSAWYGRGEVAADLAPLRHALFEALRAWLADDGYASAAIDTQMAPLERLALTGGPWVIASGLPMDAARAALDAYAGAGKTTETARAKARSGMQGWVVGAVEEPPQGWIDGVRELVKNDAVKPAGKARRKHEPNKESTRLSLAPVAAALQLPAGTLHVEGRVSQNPAWTLAQTKTKTKAKAADLVIPHTVHLFVVPDGTRTWFAAAEDPSLAATQVRGSLAGAGDAGTLKTRRDLDALRAMQASTAGFVSVSGLATWLRTDWSDEGIRKARESLTGLAALTDGGATPVPISLAARPGEGGAGHGGDVRLRLVFPIRTGLEVAASPHSIF